MRVFAVVTVAGLVGAISAEPTDPGLGATVPTPPAWVLIAGWAIGIIALAILWAASRR